MPPKPAKPVHDLHEKHQKAVQLETTVNGLLHHGAVGQAQRAFDKDWQDALLADLPLRVSFLLDHPDRNGIHKLMDLVEEGQEFQLQLLHGVNPRSKGAIAIGLVGHDAIIGWLPEDAKDMLRETGLKFDSAGDTFKDLPDDPRKRVEALAKQLELSRAAVESLGQQEFEASLSELTRHQLKALIDLLQEMLLAKNAGVAVEFKRLLGGGTYADVYEPKILAIRGLQTGNIEFEMELARPDFHHCPACERIHTGGEEKCEECLAEKKRKKPRKEAVPEAPAVPVAQAFHNLAEAKHNQRED